MREEKDRSAGQFPNPHAPRSDKPYNEENWLKPTPQADYTSATDVKPVMKMEKMSPKQKTYLGEIS